MGLIRVMGQHFKISNDRKMSFEIRYGAWQIFEIISRRRGVAGPVFYFKELLLS